MRSLLASAWVIARRDYGATVFSRVFILFLLTPFLSLLFGGVIALMGQGGHDSPPRPVIALAMDPAAARLLADARARLAGRIGEERLPGLAPLPAARSDDDDEAAARRLLARSSYVGVLGGSLDRPRLVLAGRARDDAAAAVGLIVDGARAAAVMGRRAPPPVAMRVTHVEEGGPAAGPDRIALASGAQTGMFFLLVLLAGMSLSTFVEEKSNKVIEVLVAAVPVDAIFAGKLAAMLAVSLTGVTIWVGAGLAAARLLAPGLLAHLAAPAVGWPLFAVLILVYFVVSYLLLGAVFLGLGSQAGSPREVQSMAMPVTMGQLAIFAFATSGVAHPGGVLAIAAAVFPWSSPLAMLARAAIEPALWPHLLALAWQLLWLVLALRAAAVFFRVAVLKSGGGPRFRAPWKRRSAGR